MNKNIRYLIIASSFVLGGQYLKSADTSTISGPANPGLVVPASTTPVQTQAISENSGLLGSAGSASTMPVQAQPDMPQIQPEHIAQPLMSLLNNPVFVKQLATNMSNNNDITLDFILGLLLGNVPGASTPEKIVNKLSSTVNAGHVATALSVVSQLSSVTSNNLKQ